MSHNQYFPSIPSLGPAPEVLGTSCRGANGDNATYQTPFFFCPWRYVSEIVMLYLGNQQDPMFSFIGDDLEIE